MWYVRIFSPLKLNPECWDGQPKALKSVAQDYSSESYSCLPNSPPPKCLFLFMSLLAHRRCRRCWGRRKSHSKSFPMKFASSTVQTGKEIFKQIIPTTPFLLIPFLSWKCATSCPYPLNSVSHLKPNFFSTHTHHLLTSETSHKQGNSSSS